MRQLTPAEAREVQRVKDMIVKDYGGNGTNWIDSMHGSVLSVDLVDTANKELWLNILDLALSQNETIKKDWFKSYG